MVADVKKQNPEQFGLIVDTAPYSGGLCPRRAGKTYAAVLLALITGESKPDAISVIISLNQKQLRRIYWEGASSGLFTLARKYGLNLEFNRTMLSWKHENGSMGFLIGCDDDEALENVRGMEADLYVIDECKSFPIPRLHTLIYEILEPQRASRKGRIVLIGTPGVIEEGPFFEATCDRAKMPHPDPELAAKGETVPTSIEYGKKDPYGRTPQKDRTWSRHHWTLEDNAPMAHQWEDALITKRKNGWADDHPIWQREYLGLWAGSTEGLVFRYAALRDGGRVTWFPNVTKENPTGLPENGAPWRLIAGLDIGFEDKTALVIAAYSLKLRQLRVFHDESHPHMLVDDVADMLTRAYARYGTIEAIFADCGGLGKMVVASLVARGFPIEKAEKREKFDHIELLNSAFARGEVLIVQDTTLEQQLRSVSWDLSKGTHERLARAGRLREDVTIENDSTDALLYLYRGSLHQFGVPTPGDAPEAGSPEYFKAWEKAQLAKARARHRELDRPDGFLRNNLPSPPSGVARALGNRWTSTNSATASRRFSP